MWKTLQSANSHRLVVKCLGKCALNCGSYRPVSNPGVHDVRLTLTRLTSSNYHLCVGLACGPSTLTGSLEGVLSPNLKPWRVLFTGLCKPRPYSSLLWCPTFTKVWAWGPLGGDAGLVKGAPAIAVCKPTLYSSRLWSLLFTKLRFSWEVLTSE